MRDIIIAFKSQVEELKQSIKRDIYTYLKECDYNTQSSNFQVICLKNVKDLDKVFYGAGFYIILSNLKYTDNKCSFSLVDSNAIYRGHSYNVKDRIMSHLFNSEYKRSNMLKKYSTNYTVCLKLEDGVNGIDIDKPKYSKYKWVVVVHKMKDSTEFIREQAELAFDDLYKKPLKSRESKKV